MSSIINQGTGLENMTWREWTNSDYKPYPYQANDGRENDILSHSKVIRGGREKNAALEFQLDTTRRSAKTTSYWGIDIGFRCARSISPTPTPKPTTTPKPKIPTTPVPTLPTPAAAPMIHIPAGEFIMGNDTGSDNEKPAHTVYLADYEIDKYEVSEWQYLICVKRNKCASLYEDSYYLNNLIDYPMVKVNWQQAKDYCESVGKRLPTEAEWEKAAKGTKQERITITTNWEWTSSDYEPYPYQANDGRENDMSSHTKVIRGGQETNAAKDDKSHLTRRDELLAPSWSLQLGFRCAR